LSALGSAEALSPSLKVVYFYGQGNEQTKERESKKIREKSCSPPLVFHGGNNESICRREMPQGKTVCHGKSPPIEGRKQITFSKYIMEKSQPVLECGGTRLPDIAKTVLREIRMNGGGRSLSATGENSYCDTLIRTKTCCCSTIRLGARADWRVIQRGQKTEMAIVLHGKLGPSRRPGGG